MNDVGLLRRMSNLDSRIILEGNKLEGNVYISDVNNISINVQI